MSDEIKELSEKLHHLESLGYARFVVMHGVLRWGLAMFVGMGALSFVVSVDGPDLRLLLINFVVWILGGALFGAILYPLLLQSLRKKIDAQTD